MPHPELAILRQGSETWEPWSRALLVVMGRGLHPPAGADTCERPRTGLHGQAQYAAIRMLLTMASGPAMVRN
jgi:hypothetical protein